MPRTYEFDGKFYEAPDDLSEEDALAEISRLTKPAEWGEVGRAIPGAVKRTLAEAASGGVSAVGTVLGSDAMIQEAKAARGEISAEAELETPKNMSMLQEGVLTVGPSLAVATPAALVGAGAAAFGAPAAAILGGVTTGFAAPTALSKFGETLDYGHGPSRAALHGLLHGAIEKYTEYLPLKEMAKGGVRAFLKGLGHEVVGEEIATIGQFINDKISTKPDSTLGDLAHDMAVTAISSAISGPIQAATVRATVATMSPFIKLEQLSAADKAVLDAATVAATSDGAPMPTLPMESLGAVLPAPQRVVDLADLVMPDKHPAPGEGTQRVYTVVPNDKEAPEMLTWTGDIEKVQEMVDVMGPNVRVPYVDIKPDELAKAQETEEVKDIRVKQAVDVGDFVLPLKMANSGQYLYGKMPETSVPAPSEAPPSAPKPAPVAKPEQTLILRREGKEKLRVEFEDPLSKQLFLHARHFAKTQSYVSQEQLTLERGALAQTMGVPEDQVLRIAQFYAKKVDSVVGSINAERVQMAKFDRAEYDASEARLNSPEVLARERARTLGERGKVVFAPQAKDTPHMRKMQAYLQRWLTMFAPNTSLVILTSAENTVEGAAQYLAPESPGGPGIIIAPAEGADPFDAVFSLAHEFGHHLFDTVIGRAEYTAALAEIRAEYEALKARVPDMNAREFVRAWMPASRVLNADEMFFTDSGLTPNSPAMMLVEAIDARRYPGYLLSFHEYAAEQFARYVGANQDVTLSGEVKSMWDEAYDVLKTFFDKVVRKLKPGEKYQKWVDGLRAVPPTGEQSDRLSPAGVSLRMHAAHLDTVDKVRAWTLKTLEALPKKDKILKQTIYELISRNVATRSFVDDFGEKFTQKYPLVVDDFGDAVRVKENRPEITGQEYRLLLKVLNSFDGDVVDRAQFFARVENEIVPLTTESGSTWANYGLDRIGYGYSGTQRTARTVLFKMPFEVEQYNHFSNDKKYFGHAREFDDQDGVRHVVELQSDLVQKAKNTVKSPEEWLKVAEQAELRAVGWERHAERIQLFVTQLKNPPEGFWGSRNKPQDVAPAGEYLYANEKFPGIPRAFAENRIVRTLLPNEKLASTLYSYVDPSVSPILLEIATAELASTGLRRQEDLVHAGNARLAAQANISTRINMLPERWWEVMLRKLNAMASGDGVKKMRMATADTVAKVEGWTQVPQPATQKVKLAIEVEDNLGFDSVTDALEALQEAKDDWNTRWEVSPDSAKTIDEWLNLKPDFGRNQGIYNRYAKEITNFVKKEFGAKVVEVNPEPEMSDTPTNSWLEWDVKPNLGGVPVQYYDTVQSLANASDGVQKNLEESLKDVVPDISPSFARVQGFLNQALKLSQMARMLPHVQPLQSYRRLMQQMANRKSSVMAFVNDRIKEWYSLSRKDSQGMMDMMEAEVQGEVHWTKLTKHPVTVEGKQMEMWMHEATPRVAEEAAKRGLSSAAVDLYVKIKNDYLTILGMQEVTLLRALDHIFRNNPVVASGRKAVVVKIFDNLRQKPYVPDKRFGQWSVIVKATKDTKRPDGVAVKKGEKVWFSKHESEADQKVAYAQLRKMWGPSFQVTRNYIDDTTHSMRGLPREFISSLPEALELTEEQVNKFQELSFDLTREGRYLASFMKKKSRLAGMESDMRRSYADHMWRSANAIAKMEFGWQLRSEMRKLTNLAKKVGNQGGDPVPLERLSEYVKKNYDYVMEPQHEWEQIRAITALWYLWAVPKTALMNGTTMITTTYPRLAAQYGDVKATAAIIRAMKDTTFYWKHPEKLGVEETKVWAQAKADGTTNQSFAAEAAAVADGNAIEKILPQYDFLRNAGLKDRARTASWKVLHVGMLPFRVMEEFNRRATLLAAYRLGKSAGMPDALTSVGEGSAYLAAKDTVDYTQNEYAPWDRAAFLRGKKSVALIFFSFVQNMSFFMFGGDKGWWRGWLTLMALAGLSGLPGAENVIDLLNWLGRKFFDEPVDLRVEAREMSKAFGMNPDWVLHGAMHSMFGLGWDASSSVGMGRIIPGTDAIFGQGDASKRVLQMSGEIFGPFGGLTVNILQAMMDDNPNSMVRFERAAPTFLRNLSRGVRAGSEDRWTDARGRTLIDEATGLEVLGQVLGFQPEEKALKQEMRHYQSEAAQFYALRRQHLLTALWQATEAGESEAIGEARAKIAAFNAMVPDRQLTITPQEIRQSLRARLRQQRQIESGVAAAKRYRPLYERIGATAAE